MSEYVYSAVTSLSERSLPGIVAQHAKKKRSGGVTNGNPYTVTKPPTAQPAHTAGAGMFKSTQPGAIAPMLAKWQRIGQGKSGGRHERF